MSVPTRLALAMLLLHATTSTVAASTYQLQQYGPLRVARCVARCWTQSEGNKEPCENSCLKSNYTKPGSCPSSEQMSVFDVACIQACTMDSECSRTLKCCKHSCGVTCQQAQGLQNVTGLPAVPENVTVMQRRHGRNVQLDWDEPSVEVGENSTDPILYLIEERHHTGRHLMPERFGAWTTRHRSTRTTTILKNMLKPGRWYQFRVAAINANGSKGFSEPSEAFKLSLAPRAPGQPQNLSVGHLTKINDTFRGVLTWLPPMSDLPIQRYKVYWSRQLQGATTTQRHVLVHHQTVPGDVLRFVLKSLKPESLYFLQVQAMTQFGRERLKSDKAGIVINTSRDLNVTETLAQRRSVRELQSLLLQKVFWDGSQLLARLVWHPSVGTSSRYTITWQPISCPGHHYITHRVETNVSSVTLFGLDFNCEYQIIQKTKSYDTIAPLESSLTFRTPACEELNQAEKPPCFSN